MIDSEQELIAANFEETWEWVWKLHKRVKRLEKANSKPATTDEELDEWKKRALHAECELAACIKNRKHDAVTMETLANNAREWKAKADANQDAADTLERLKDGDEEEIGGVKHILAVAHLVQTWRHQVVERAAIAAKLSESEQRRIETVSMCSQLESEKADLERRLADSEERERGHVAMIGAKCDEIAELKRRLDEWWQAVGTDCFNHTEQTPLQLIADLRRDAERWRWFESNAAGYMRVMIDSDIAAEKAEKEDAAIAAEKAKEET